MCTCVYTCVQAWPQLHAACLPPWETVQLPVLSRQQACQPLPGTSLLCVCVRVWICVGVRVCAHACPCVLGVILKTTLHGAKGCHAQSSSYPPLPQPAGGTNWEAWSGPREGWGQMCPRVSWFWCCLGHPLVMNHTPKAATRPPSSSKSENGTTGQGG